MKYINTILMLGGALILIAGPNPCAAAQEHADFSGIWQLNEKMSDDPVRLLGDLKKQTERSRGSSSSRTRSRNNGVRGGGRGNLSSNMAGNPGKEVFGKDREKQHLRIVMDLRKALSHLEIFHEGNEFNITDGRDLSQVLMIGGKENTVWTDRGEMRATAAYQGESLVISLKQSRGRPDTTRTYMLSDDGKNLTVIEERILPRLDMPLRIRSYYDRVEKRERAVD